MHFREKVDFILEDFDDGAYTRLVAVNKIQLAAEREIKETVEKSKNRWIFTGVLIGVFICLVIYYFLRN